MATINARELRYSVEEARQIYDNEPFTGTARYYDRDGALIGENSYVNGVQQGQARYWYPSGQLKGEEVFVNDGLHGPCKEWHENGRLKREALFERSRLVRDKQWDESGNLIEDMQQNNSVGRLEKTDQSGKDKK